MDALNKIKTALIAVALVFAVNAPAEDFPSGGYQGGTHGNIKVKMWSGAVNSQWNDAGNWCPASIPCPQDDVVISATASNMPEISVEGMVCKDLTIENGASLSIDPGIILTIYGQLKIKEE